MGKNFFYAPKTICQMCKDIQQIPKMQKIYSMKIRCAKCNGELKLLEPTLYGTTNIKVYKFMETYVRIILSIILFLTVYLTFFNLIIVILIFPTIVLTHLIIGISLDKLWSKKI